jgi:hypothetical protein
MDVQLNSVHVINPSSDANFERVHACQLSVASNVLSIGNEGFMTGYCVPDYADYVFSATCRELPMRFSPHTQDVTLSDFTAPSAWYMTSNISKLKLLSCALPGQADFASLPNLRDLCVRSCTVDELRLPGRLDNLTVADCSELRAIVGCAPVTSIRRVCTSLGVCDDTESFFYSA